MKDVKVTIENAIVKSLSYTNEFNIKPGTPMKVAVNNQMAVKLNPAQPTRAVVIVKFTAKDEEDKSIHLEAEFLIGVSVSTFVDNLDEMIKKNYMGHIMLSVNEKLRELTSTIGFSIQIPGVTFNYNDSQDTLDTQLHRV